MTAEIADVLSGARRWALLHADCLQTLAQIQGVATYAQLARDRLTAEERGSTLQAQRAGQEPLFR